ncbi:MAG: hypothetical protein WCJ02_14150, partial [bacterium]
SQTFWGFRQITDGGSMAGTLNDLDKVAEESGNPYGAPVVLAITLVSWLIGMVLYSFVTGAVVNAFEGRRERIEGGKTRYKFMDHGIVVGWDFQGVAAVMSMFDIWGMKEVLVLSEKPAEEIRAELENELDETTMQKVCIYNGTLGVEVNVDELYPEKSRVIVVLGDRNDFDNDGGNLKIGAILRRKISDAFKRNPPPADRPEIKMFIDISNTYNLSIAEMYPAEGYEIPKGIEFHIVNFCKATALELFASFVQFVDYNTGRKKGVYETSYCPLTFRHNTEATHNHLVVSGVGAMAKAMVVELAPLMAGGREDGVITVFSSDAGELNRFASAFPFHMLKGVRLEFVNSEIDEAKNRRRVAEIARDATASVTFVITNENADEAYAMANRLLAELRFENVRLLVEQRILSKWAHKTYPLRLMGFRDVAFFGFTDRYFASLGQKIRLTERLLAGENISGLRNRYFVASFADGLLENLQAHGYRFDYNPSQARQPTLVFDKEELTRLSKFEHARNVNFQILHGLSAGQVDDNVFMISSTIRAWDELTDSQREIYASRISRAMSALNELYNCGEYPYIVEKNEFRKIIGVLPDESVAETLESRGAIRDAVVSPVIKESKWRQPDGREKSEASVAMVLTPGKGLARQMYRLSVHLAIPMIVVLPKPANEYLQQLDSEAQREEMARWLRNAYEVVVVDDAEIFIRGRATVIANDILRR